MLESFQNIQTVGVTSQKPEQKPYVMVTFIIIKLWWQKFPCDSDLGSVQKVAETQM